MEPFEIRVPATTRGGREVPALVLSVPTVQDVERITKICQDPDIQEWTTVPSPYRMEDAHGFVTDMVDPGWESGRELSWAVREVSGSAAGPVLVGMMGISTVTSGVWEIGFWQAPEARGQGTVTRAGRAVIDMAFDPAGPVQAKAMRWRCEIHDGVPNWASWRVAWLLGFRREGRVRSLLPNKGDLHEGWVGTLLPGDPRVPSAPWDGPAGERVEDSSGAVDRRRPLVPHDGVGEREGDDPEALVRRFHHVYGLPIRTDGPSLERESLQMRMSLIAEEFAELVGAVYGQEARSEIETAVARAVETDDASRDVVDAADALADLVYVIYGMALETGIDLAAVLAEVQRSNMSKLGEDGKPIYRQDGKVLKGPGFFPPDVAGVLGLGSK